ncbi:multicopper oxidase family protein [Rhodoplanes sp. Z2-YC6860]|uniref:multicopper oxidase family protein n=1 Tax=Rhodoplanes sp. Z2-YC6860 TaxID=674703 RepID=UPI000ABC40DF|nr:multicopper oxidase family protein [Rhodoplanes sp. Z2-YC6860]
MDSTNRQPSQSSSWLDRRGFVIGAGAAGAALGSGLGVAYSQIANAPDHVLQIAPTKLELAPGKVIETFAYNGTVPGPLLRVREGQQVSIDITNNSDIDDIVHWHGLYLPAAADGAMEEGSPMIQRGSTQRISFAAKPAGTRWYHSHNIAGRDLTRSVYAGLYGFFIVEPASNPARYDREVLLAAHHWEPRWVSMQDIRKGPPPDNGLEVLYASASLNDKMLGHGEPIRVREGERVLFRLLNASATENVTLALAGHRLTVVALDGNPVPTQRTVETVFLAPAERADVVVEMNRPGVWILGSVKDDDRKIGLGTVVEYANQSGDPQWQAPTSAGWDYTMFGTERAVPEPDHRLELLFEKVPGGRGGYNRWNLNGNSWPNTRQLLTTEVGKRYRLIMTNKSGDNHPVHLHRHTFEVTKVGDKKTAGLMKDTVNMTRYSSVEIDFVADDPGPSLLHCHHQDHQDEGFMGLVTYI